MNTETTMTFLSEDDSGILGVYGGGSIRTGKVVGRRTGDSTVEMLYHCVTVSGELKAGQAVARFTHDSDRVSMHLDWQWLTGDRTGGRSEWILVERVIPAEGRALGPLAAVGAAGFREISERDIDELFVVRAATRQNAISKERLAEMGITSASIAAAMAAGTTKGWVGVCDSRIGGFCMGNRVNGEVLVLAVLPDFEGRGIGATLLSTVVDWLRAFNPPRVWLGASADPETRAYGFYRAAGWRPVGEIDAHGDEILVLSSGAPSSRRPT